LGAVVQISETRFARLRGDLVIEWENIRLC
jgi:hypothetical protein